MPFNSLEYLVFYLGVLITAWLVAGRPRIRIFFLLLASYYFYTANNGLILLLLIGSTIIDFMAGLKIEQNKRAHIRKLWLLGSLTTNLGLLGFFKYYNFFLDSLVATGLPQILPGIEVLLPVGISFYTFQSMSYTIDVYQRRLKAEKSFTNFAFFVAFFPQLVAGPIVRAKYFLHQIDEPARLTLKGFEASLFLIFTGLFKKIVLGDSLGDYADHAFSDPQNIGALTAWLGLYAFTFQIYFDFSGYTDIAIGCARLLGFRLPPNFRRPYTAASFSEFWRRWHISLSYWLRDYLYKPLGGNRGSALFTHRNLMITMLLGGLWHGANWTFVIWGAMHGLFLVIERVFGLVKYARDYKHAPFRRFTRSFVIFFFIALTWLPFRATDFSNLQEMSKALFNFTQPEVITIGTLFATLIILCGFAAQWIGETVSFKRLALKQHFLLRAIIYSGIIVLVMVFASRGTEPFIYFRF